MQPSNPMRQVLEAGNAVALRRLWGQQAAHLPQPHSDAEAEVMLHHARTVAHSIPFHLRAYSHAWLTERGSPSGLPDELRPRAERLHPRIVPTVLISVNSRYPEVAHEIHGAMRDAVYEAEADGRLEDAPFVRGRMLEERAKARRRLFGRERY